MTPPEFAITVRCKNPPQRVAEPVTIGVPFAKGLVRDPGVLRLFDSAGADQALQTRVLDRWSDGSARWVLCDWQANANGEATFRIRVTDEVMAKSRFSLPGQTPLPIPLSGIVTGSRIQSALSPIPESLRASRFIPHSEADVRGLVQQIGSREITSQGIRVEAEGKEYSTLPDFDWYIEDEGPLRVCLLECGSLTHKGKHIARYAMRTHYFANCPVARVHFTIHNPKRAQHPGGLWDLGDAGSISLRDAYVKFPLPGVGRFEGQISTERSMPFTAFASRVELNQVSSGGENWQSTNHLSRTRKVPSLFRGYELRLDHQEREGLRATPIVALQRGDAQIAVSFPHFWQNFPKGIDADGDGIVLHLFPRKYCDPHEIQGGEQKEHVFFVAFGRDTITADPLEWTRGPLIPSLDAEWVASTDAISYFTPKANDPHGDYQQLADAAIEGKDTFEKKREAIDEYGWRNFGDIYGDHEAILHTEFRPTPRVSHYNNQYDAIAGFAVHWLRSGDIRWFHQFRELAWHVRDIDIYHTDKDKSAYNHGLFWHTYHYVDADTGTHRSYPKKGRVPPKGNAVPGGGPGSEHNYAHGLLLHYCLTGDEASKEAATELARWVIDMDDGSKTVFGMFYGGDTGLASASRSPEYQGPGRGSGNSLAVLLDGHRLTGDKSFLNKAETIIHRVVHPSDDVTRMVGFVRDGKVFVDAENCWFYVVFLQSLGKYLDYKAERGELDEHYTYGRACLLQYARWMAENEYPYLDRPEILEYPTETWVAQDLRKSDVFDYAYLHAMGSQRERFRERSEFFFRKSVETLTAMPTRTLCRPVVLALTNGWRRAWFAAHPEAQRPAPPRGISDFGPRVKFVPQKSIAMRRAKMVAASGVVLIVATAVALALWVFK